MGKGDKRTAKGKRIMGTYGNTRKRKSSKPIHVSKNKTKPAKEKAETAEATSKKPAAKKTATKKTAAKKTTTKKASSKSTEAKEK